MECCLLGTIHTICRGDQHDLRGGAYALGSLPARDTSACMASWLGVSTPGHESISDGVCSLSPPTALLNPASHNSQQGAVITELTYHGRPTS
eukprot:352409-Chlamydomonas_euryale.AAC.6